MLQQTEPQQPPNRHSATGSSGAPRTQGKVKTPWWRRITALFTLGSVVVVSGLALAVMITLAVLMAVFIVERAIA